LNVFGADSVEGGIISTDTECFERVVEGGGGGEREDVGEEAIEGDVVGWARTTVAGVEGVSVFTAVIRVETVWSGLETAGPIFEDTAAAAMCSSCDRSRRVCVIECDQERRVQSKRGQRG